MIDPIGHEVDLNEYFNPDEPEIDEEEPESFEEDANGYSEEAEPLEPEYNLEDEWDWEDALLESFEQDKHVKEGDEGCPF